MLLCTSHQDGIPNHDHRLRVWDRHQLHQNVNMHHILFSEIIVCIFLHNPKGGVFPESGSLK
jgi:hypothetical protein